MFLDIEAIKLFISLLLNRSRCGRSRGAYQGLIELLEPLKCKIFILDNPLRHARCCTLHKKRLKGLPKFLEMQNRVLAQNFGSKVLNHKKYLGLPTKKTYDQKIYRSTLRKMCTTAWSSGWLRSTF